MFLAVHFSFILMFLPLERIFYIKYNGNLLKQKRKNIKVNGRISVVVHQLFDTFLVSSANKPFPCWLTGHWKKSQRHPVYIPPLLCCPSSMDFSDETLADLKASVSLWSILVPSLKTTPDQTLNHRKNKRCWKRSPLQNSITQTSALNFQL